jgi:gliding motility-associated-like protein
MRIWRTNIIVSLLWLFQLTASSQTTCTNPLPPALTSVSVQPETGFTDFTWTLSPSADIAAYLIYSYYNEGGIPRGDIIDTIWDPAAITYTYKSTISNYFSVSFVIAAFRIPSCTSPFSNVINTLFSNASIDTCNKKILITWNSYPSVPKNVTDYSILVSVNGGSYTEAGKAGSEKNSFILSEFTNDADYCFVVRANIEGGIFSTSNKTCLSTKMQKPPDWINADYATVNENNYINISFSVDPLSEIKTFRLERKTEVETDFQAITQIEPVNGLIRFTDKTADPYKKNYYRLLAVNNCGNPVVSSNLSCNIVSNLEKNGNIISLKWNSYRFWLGEVSKYKVYINTGNGFHEQADVPDTDTVYTLNYSSVMYDITGSNLCFYISASETANPHGITGETGSAATCTEIIELITVPNAFTPNNDLTNDLFKPVFSFTPSDYHMVITDRKNNILFESRDQMEEWDGKQNGNTLPQGVYLWLLKVKTPSGKQVSRSGTVTIIK